MRFYFLFLSLFLSIGVFGQKYTISGYVKDITNGEDIYGAIIKVKELENVGTKTNAYGFYSITLDQGTYTLIYRSTGFETQEMPVVLNEDQSINIELTVPKDVLLIEEVVISAEKENDNITSCLLYTSDAADE